MGRSRLDFQQELRTLAPKAWYLRPPDNRISYPCFVYKSVSPRMVRADNLGYLRSPGDEVLYISETENEAIIDALTERFPFCSPGAPYISDDLFHYPFTIYY